MSNCLVNNNIKYCITTENQFYTVGTDETNDTNAIDDYSIQSDILSIPKYIGWKKVTKIGQYSFRNAPLLKKVYINADITIIAKYAFDLCTNIEYINIPSSVEIIEDHSIWLSRTGDGITSSGTAIIAIQSNSKLKSFDTNAFGNKENFVFSYCGPKTLEICNDETFKNINSITLYTYSGINICSSVEKTINIIPKDVLCPYITPTQTIPCTFHFTPQKTFSHFHYIYLLYSNYSFFF